MKKIPVTIFTGFLGAGKTTLLNQALDHFKAFENAVIENEFGEVAIDGDLVATSCDMLFEMDNGCLCCALNKEFYELLKQIVFGEKTPDRLWVEATGVADTTALIEMFKRPDIASRFDLYTVVCVVDATNVIERIEEAIEVSQQMIASDLVLINKVEGLSSDALHTMNALIAGINPFATILPVRKGEIPKHLFEGQRTTIELDQLENPPTNYTANAHKINSVSYQTAHGFDLLKLKTVLHASLLLYAHQIFRIKGIICSEEQRKVLVQAVGKNIELTDLGEWTTEVESKIVVIGLELKASSIARLLRNTEVKFLQNSNVS